MVRIREDYLEFNCLIQESEQPGSKGDLPKYSLKSFEHTYVNEIKIIGLIQIFKIIRNRPWNLLNC